jgi:hypothetical protein
VASGDQGHKGIHTVRRVVVSARRLIGFSEEFLQYLEFGVVLLLSEYLMKDSTFALEFRYTSGHPRPCNVRSISSVLFKIF